MDIQEDEPKDSRANRTQVKTLTNMQLKNAFIHLCFIGILFWLFLAEE